jgi:outer membrane protein TolC
LSSKYALRHAINPHASSPAAPSSAPCQAAPVLAGRHRAQSAQAHAQYDEQVAAYRNTVLTAYQEVEDKLAALRQLEQESLSEAAAVTATGKALEQARYRYSAGLVTYLEVATTETIALQAQQSRVNILNRRMDASVLLVKALGGGWRIEALAQAQSSAGATAALEGATRPPPSR